LLNKLFEVLFVLAQLGAAIVLEKSMKQNVLGELCGTCWCFVRYFNWKFETFFFSRGWIVLNFFLNFEQTGASCSYKIVLIKKSVNYSRFYSKLYFNCSVENVSSKCVETFRAEYFHYYSLSSFCYSILF